MFKLNDHCRLIGEQLFFLFLIYFLLLNEFISCSCTMIITTHFYSISIPQPQSIPPTPQTVSVGNSKSVSQYLFCKEVHSFLFSDSTCQ